MSDRSVRIVAALLVPVVALVVAHWYDQSVLADSLQRAHATFEMGGYANELTLTHLVGAIGAVAVVLAAIWARSGLVGALYVIVGGATVLLPALWAAFAINQGANAAEPGPIARFLDDQMSSGIGAGPTGIALTIGGATLVAGLVSIVIQLSPRSRTVQATEATATSGPA